MNGRLRELLSLDLRSLAVFRVALGLNLLADLALRARDLTAFFTDLGVLPRAAFPGVNDDWIFSLHLGTGTFTGAALLFSASAVAAISLLVGLHTRASTAVVFVLWNSMQSRNVYTNDGGDMLLIALVFWALFLPLGARFSLDALRAPADAEPATSTRGMAVGALLLQLFEVYALAAVHKAHSYAWTHGETLWYVTHLDQLATPLAHALAPHTTLCHLGTWGALAFELLVPLLLFVPWRVDAMRLLAALGFMGLHLAFLALLRLGLFPFVGVMAWTAIVPWSAYQRLGRALGIPRLATRLAGPLQKLKPFLVEGPRPWTESGPVGRLAAGLCATGMLLWNLTTVVDGLKPLQAAFNPALHALRLDQEWLMFDGAPKDDGWFVVPAKLADGREVDVLTGGPVRFDHPDDVPERFADQRWGNWQRSLAVPENEALLPLWATWLCRAWNDPRPASEHARTLEIDWVHELTLPDREAPPERQVRLSGACRDPQ